MKKIAVLAFIVIFAGAPAVFAQLDTLELVGVGSITLSQSITNLYVQDLNGDSLQEIILTDSSFVYVYDGPTRQLLWRSPELQRPRDLKYGDLDGDSLFDIAVQDNQHIWLFNPHDSNLVWMSPILDSTFSCFTIGDINSDSINDFIFLRKEIFTRRGNDDNRDTVWLDYYPGPVFARNGGYAVTMSNIDFVTPEGYGVNKRQGPEKAIVVNLSGIDGNRQRIVIFSRSITTVSSGYSHAGGIWVNDAVNYQGFYYENIGYLEKAHEIMADDLRRLYAIFGSYIWSQTWVMGNWTYRQGILSADTLTAYSQICLTHHGYGYETTHWWGAEAGDLNPNLSGEELCFGCIDTLKELRLPSLSRTWSVVDSNLNQVVGVINDVVLSDNVIIMIGYRDSHTEYHFIRGTNGQTSAILLTESEPIDAIGDLNDDLRDELFSIQGGTMHIYSIQHMTGTDELIDLPAAFSLSPAYPNPFNSTTTISFSLAAPGEIALEIFDILGRRVATLQEGHLIAGDYRVTWDAGDNSSGVYFYRLRAGAEELTRRCLLLK
jgi:hypothetical protein